MRGGGGGGGVNHCCSVVSPNFTSFFFIVAKQLKIVIRKLRIAPSSSKHLFFFLQSLNQAYLNFQDYNYFMFPLPDNKL